MCFTYLSRLRKEGIITRVGYGRYRLGDYERIPLGTSPKVKQITNLIKVEPSKKRMSDIFDLLEEPVVIFQRKDSYATFTQNNIRFPQPEKIIIDLYFYITRLGFPYPPDEYGRVLYYILKNKNLNFDRLKRYASRRGLNEKFSNLLSRMKDKYPELREEGLDPLFKGGSAVQLLLPDGWRRLSINLDLVIKTSKEDFEEVLNNVHEKFGKEYHKTMSLPGTISARQPL